MHKWNSLKVAAVASVAFFSASLAFADNPLPKDNEKIEKYGNVEGWQVFANKTRGNCYIARVEGSGAVQMGVTRDKSVGYLGVFTKEDIKIKDGAQSGVAVSIDGNLYVGIATGISGKVQGGYVGGYILADNADFKRDLAKKYKMIVFPKTKAAFEVDLKGTYKAMEMGRKCLGEQ